MPVWNLRSEYEGKYIFKSAMELVNAGYTLDSTYLIDLPVVGPTYTYCLLDPKWNGGGWMMAMKATTGTTFNYDASYWTTDNTLNPTYYDQKNFDAKFEVMNKYPAKDIMARWRDIAATASSSGGIPGSVEWTWLENDFNAGQRQTLISFFNSPSGLTYTNNAIGGSGYFLRDAKTFTGWASGIFSSQTGIRFYGFNYASNQGVTNFNCKVRWGFGWNENGENLFPCTSSTNQGTNDVSGGIGMDSRFGSYSAGDYISCCQDTTGIATAASYPNGRSARVEVYIR